jgi:competence protein ComEC
VLHPTELTGESNEDSVVFRLTFGEVTFLFTGDAEATSEHEMLEAGFELKADILKVGHHGSDTSSTVEFLAAVDPEIAIWSAGRDNTYGHPHQITLDHLAELGVTVYGTAVDGTVVVETDGQSFAVVEYDPDGGHGGAGCAPNQININTATADELEEIVQIGPARAVVMIELRPFSSVDDMVRIPGITENALTRIKGQGLACVE